MNIKKEQKPMKPSLQKDGKEAYMTNYLKVSTVNIVKQFWPRYEKINFRFGYTTFRRMVRAA